MTPITPAIGAMITNFIFSGVELYYRLKAEDPNLFSKSDDEKMTILAERIIKESQKPADYAQKWRPGE